MKDLILRTFGLKPELASKVGVMYLEESEGVKFSYFRRLNLDSDSAVGFTKPRREGEISEPAEFRYNDVVGLFLPFENDAAHDRAVEELAPEGRYIYEVPIFEKSNFFYHLVEGVNVLPPNLDEFALEKVLLLDNYTQGKNRDIQNISFFDKAYLKGDFVRFTNEKPFKLRVVEPVLRREVVDLKRFA